VKVLIAIETCNGQRTTHQQIRDTWLKDCPADHVFFSGRRFPHPYTKDLPVEKDEVFLDFPDVDFLPGQLVNLLWKMDVLEHEWALEKGYDFIFHAHNDTYVVIPRLLKSGFEKYDWSGQLWPVHAMTCQMINGASGVWFNRKAMEFLIKAIRANPDLYLDMEATAEDWRVARYLDGHIEPTGDNRYSVKEWPRPENDIITYHHLQGGMKSLRILEELMAVHNAAKDINA
jgi:hypothetical protein